MTLGTPDPKHAVSPTVESLIRTYIHAKDSNRPHLMASTFAPDASLTMLVKSEAISFPAQTQGQSAIADVLSRRFGQNYDNVYTFCLDTPPADKALDSYRCDWLVGMTEKASGSVRVGCGSYLWQFAGTEKGLRVQGLEITIEAMQVLAAEHAEAVLDQWLATLSYPWCTASTALATAPQIAELAPVLDYIKR
ncbi:hypothetical protein FXN63_16855 [Pigmentiphaga aceris]|uniref:SnoaL-like domain-containing protein n=1 Tax=Pigmentiphaga aceris TaxID=1940612 RepID=A0A5C0AY66_9BURK|nr:hypothetical protein [Pigmentiphaga aceris]QEI07328.1 hypothetical protein FXN63_16855 [Pigmentiphaga aceris]